MLQGKAKMSGEGIEYLEADKCGQDHALGESRIEVGVEARADGDMSWERHHI